MLILVEVDEPEQVGRRETKRWFVYTMQNIAYRPTFNNCRVACDIVEVHPATKEHDQKTELGFC